MPNYSAHSKRQLATCHRDLRVVFYQAIDRINIRVMEGLRPRVRQNRLKEKGKSQLGWPHSKHNRKAWPKVPDDPSKIPEGQKSMALDAAPWPVDWNDSWRFEKMGFYVLGLAEELYQSGKIEHRLVWGNDWDQDLKTVKRDPDDSFADLSHFELVRP